MLRDLCYRTGRRLYCWARRESPNRPETNGEYALLTRVLRLAKGPTTLLDVGANLGEWSRKAVALGRAGEADLAVHAFEPHSGTRAMLAEAVSGLSEIRIESLALSNSAGIDFERHDST
jgi:hypothetical protein